MRIHNVYEDANGESHFRDMEVDWVEETPTGKLSKRLPATGIVFRETTADYENSWHQAPRRQYVISLADGISITASDGETRHIRAGEIVLVEDTTGKGHITKSSGGTPALHDLRADRLTGQRPHQSLGRGSEPVVEHRIVAEGGRTDQGDAGPNAPSPLFVKPMRWPPALGSGPARAATGWVGRGARVRAREPSPCPADDMICWPVSVRIDNVKNK